jgi:tetratricopeptide (TPR) repeat protein
MCLPSLFAEHVVVGYKHLAAIVQDVVRYVVDVCETQATEAPATRVKICGCCRLLVGIGWRARILEAMLQARQALRLYRIAEDPRGEVRALYAIGWHLIQLGEYEQAINFSSRALALCRAADQGAVIFGC